MPPAIESFRRTSDLNFQEREKTTVIGRRGEEE